VAETRRLDPDSEAFHADPDDHWGLPERTAQDAPPLTQEEQRRRRAQGALALKIRGADYGQIADALDYASPHDARRAVEILLAEVAEADGPAAWQTQRQLARARLEGLLAAVFPIATDSTDEGFFPAQRQAGWLVERINVLDGLNAPTRHVIYSPQAAEFDETVRKMLEASGVSEAHEGDIFELTAEIIEDPEEGELDEDIVDAEEVDDAPEAIDGLA